MTKRALRRAAKVGLFTGALLSLSILAVLRSGTAAAELQTPQLLRTSGSPFGVAVDAQRARAYVSDTKENALFVFDLHTSERIAVVPTGPQPGQVVLFGDRVYVSNFAGHSLTVVDVTTNTPVSTLVVGGLGLAVNPQTGRLFAAEGSDIAVLDLATSKRIGAMAAPSGASLWGVAVDVTTNSVFATDIASARVLVYDAADNHLVREIAIDAPARFGIAAGAAGEIVVASYTDHDPKLTVIDAASGAVSKQRTVASFTNALARDVASGKIYATSTADRSLTAVDLGLNGSSAKTSVDGALGPVVINPLTGAPLVVTSGAPTPAERVPANDVPVVRP